MKLKLSLFFVLLSATLLAQDLYLKNPKSGKERLIKSGRKICVWQKDQTEAIKGRYQVLNDSTISIGDKNVPLNEIEIIRVSTNPERIGSIIAGILPAMLTAYGFSALSYSDDQFAWFMIGFGSGAPPLTASILGIVNGRKRKASKGWELKIQ
ncbi:hypothetical protein K6119_11370 [Paracrocinitomix mangrovi]|uniref:hypothetical protein n=1 Tax=Paracrocinitomix mangrovi TaxID=2862509 RepID=UPI001C8DEE16|nr:hypothetical protein [Paracrocinitomix mangrovi]UKN00334.1 hypothetical protein K6119_11370 [Paracrocinitomix mangrovi]